MGHAVAQLVEALWYNPEGHGFDWFNPFGRTMALGSTQPLTEIVPGIFSRGKAAGALDWKPSHLHGPNV